MNYVVQDSTQPKEVGEVPLASQVDKILFDFALNVGKESLVERFEK